MLRLFLTSREQKKENKKCPEPESNQRHEDFQSSALPTELSGHFDFLLETSVNITWIRENCNCFIENREKIVLLEEWRCIFVRECGSIKGMQRDVLSESFCKNHLSKSSTERLREYREEQRRNGKNSMKMILTAVNAKYIHSNLAVYTLQASAEKAGVFPEIREFTINQSKDSMLRSLFLAHADVVCVSCYIWNISIVEDLITEYHKISPETKIWLGGPEVSYHAEEMLEQYPFLDGIMKGEGEITFRELAVYYQNQENGTEGKTLEEIHGITYRDAEGAIKSNPWRPVMDLSEVDFPYANLKKFENRIIYYESSRGCPFSCSYCLSSIDKRLRFRNLDLVKKELGLQS